MTKTPSTPSKTYGDVVHCDISFGPVTAHGGINYCILFVDKATRTNLIQPLKTLTQKSILAAFKSFLLQFGVTPKKIRTDFDQKIIGGTVCKFLTDNEISIKAAPPKHQD